MSKKDRKFIAAVGEDLVKSEPEEVEVSETGEPMSPFAKALTDFLNGPGKSSPERLAFTTDPAQYNRFQSLYRAKLRLIPDTILKRLGIQDDLVAAIVHGRQNQLSPFGRPRKDRFSLGYILEPSVGLLDRMSPEEKKELDKRIEKAVRKLWTCGSTEGVDRRDQISFSEWLSQSVRNALIVGRIANELIYVQDSVTGEDKFHSWRLIDAGTIYKAAAQKSAAESVRAQAAHLLSQLNNKKIEPEKFQNDEYAWVQVIEGRPVQAFTDKECVVHNFYAVPDVELDGYPVTPLDTVISAVTTHINITSHNKLYFQSGRASKGMVVIKSDSVDENVVKHIKSQFNASINSVANSWRMPVFGVGSKEDVEWHPFDAAGARDMEFQYLTDMNVRVILSAFQMSPEELPGWSYLSRGTNSQALSESSNEYRIEAARDLGLRPLLASFEDFVNAVIFPLIDHDLSKICRFRFMGLDAETEEKESVRLSQDMVLHYTYDQILHKVEKRPVGRTWGGEFPFNQSYQAILDRYFYVGAILERFMGIEGASGNPELQYIRDPFWFQWQQLRMQMAQATLAAQQQQQQAELAAQQQQQAPAPGGEAPVPAGMVSAEPTEKRAAPQKDSGGPSQEAQQVSGAVDQAVAEISKSDMAPDVRNLLRMHESTVDTVVEAFRREMLAATREVGEIVDRFKPVE